MDNTMPDQSSIRSSPPSCYNVPIGKDGTGIISVPPGKYTVYSSDMCPSDKTCSRNNHLSLLGLPLYIWHFDPASFTLNSQGVININAVSNDISCINNSIFPDKLW